MGTFETISTDYDLIIGQQNELTESSDDIIVEENISHNENILLSSSINTVIDATIQPTNGPLAIRIASGTTKIPIPSTIASKATNEITSKQVEQKRLSLKPQPLPDLTSVSLLNSQVETRRESAATLSSLYSRRESTTDGQTSRSTTNRPCEY